MDVYTRLLEQARLAREKAYAPYSRFAVGAALLTEDGEIITGCNVENVSYGLTICAERVAAFTAVAAGRKKISGLALVADLPEPPTPCGACRQVLAEFAPEMWILCANLEGKQRIFRLTELLPEAFAEFSS
ncbi:MAG TPA: cytidine deaminase [Firmicutes bacterium]|jgi:cytidine deaminase|nr:cytidine deaminase [Bacillota bacterium]